jgi:hypothetical protein
MAGIRGGEHCKAAADGVAQYDAVLGVPEFQAVEKAFVAGVKEGPMLAAIFGQE